MEEPLVVDEDWHATGHFSKGSRDQNGRPCSTVTRRELHQAVSCKKSGTPEGQGALVCERSTRQRNRFLRSGQCAEDSSKIPSEVASLGNLADARRTEDGAGRAHSSAAGASET